MVNSGTNVDQTVVFAAGSSQLTADITFSIIDDTVGLEDIQSYQLSISEASSSDVTVGPFPRTTVTIIDDEGMYYIECVYITYIYVYIYYKRKYIYIVYVYIFFCKL